VPHFDGDVAPVAQRGKVQAAWQSRALGVDHLREAGGEQRLALERDRDRASGCSPA
jgi:hypothetical protein